MSESWFRVEYERAKRFNASIPEHARLVVTNPALSAHTRTTTEQPDNTHDTQEDR